MNKATVALLFARVFSIFFRLCSCRGGRSCCSCCLLRFPQRLPLSAAAAATALLLVLLTFLPTLQRNGMKILSRWSLGKEY